MNNQGDQLALAGAKQAADHADEVIVEWTKKAYQMLLDYPYDQFKAEEVRAWAEASGLEAAPDRRAWGHIIRKGAHEKIIRKVKMVTKSDLSAHSAPVALWVAVGSPTDLRLQNACPFCSCSPLPDTALILLPGGTIEPDHAVRCSTCGTRGPVAHTEQEAQRLWRIRQ